MAALELINFSINDHIMPSKQTTPPQMMVKLTLEKKVNEVTRG